MAHITIDRKTISNVENDNLIALLNNMIDNELSREVEDIDTNFVDECVNALIELEKEENSFTALVPLMSSEKFLKKLTGDKNSAFRRLNVFARTALAAAIIAGGAFSANAAIYAVTGVNVFDNIATAIEQRLNYSQSPTGSENIDVGFEEDEPTTIKETTTVKEQPTVKPTVPAEKETTTKPAVTGSENTDAGFEEDDDITIPTTKRVLSIEAEPATNEYKKNEDNAVTLKSIKADLTNYKTDYVYGELFSINGLVIKAIYSDGSERKLSPDDYHYNKIYNTNVTANYTLTVTYKSCTLDIPITVRPDEETRGSVICSNDDFDYLLTKKGAYITKYKGGVSSIRLNFADGNQIIAIGSAAFSGTEVKSIVGLYVERVFDNAFKGCSTLESCDFPRLTNIGSSAFENCSALGSIIYSPNAASIGQAAFKNTGFESFTLPEGMTKVPDYMLEGAQKLKEVTMSGKVSSIGRGSFAECIALERVNGCAGIKEVGAYAFYDDELVDFDTFPQSIEVVGDGAFYFCRSLNIGSLPQSIKSLGKSSFTYCTGLTELTIPKSITVIPYDAFRACGAETVTIPEGVVEIEDYALRAIKAQEIRLPNSLKRIGVNSVYSPLLMKIYFGNGLEYIADNAFYQSKSAVMYVYNNSLAMEYAIDNGFKYQIV